ncbi:hypothetical protein FRC05_010412 [Tulasnella sp. 425]|nr:hypothetical protein FRC05_010412 [Tulasnella sp. 425]
MWNEAKEYSTSLGRVLIQVRNGQSRGVEFGTSSQTKLQSAGQTMKSTPGTANIKERAPLMKDADVSSGREQSNHSGDGGALAIGDEKIEEIPAPALLAETAPTSSTPTSSNINYPEPNTSQRTAYKRSGGKTVTQHQWDVYDFIRTIPRGKVVTYKVSITFMELSQCYRWLTFNLLATGYHNRPSFWFPSIRSVTLMDSLTSPSIHSLVSLSRNSSPR